MNSIILSLWITNKNEFDIWSIWDDIWNGILGMQSKWYLAVLFLIFIFSFHIRNLFYELFLIIFKIQISICTELVIDNGVWKNSNSFFFQFAPLRHSRLRYYLKSLLGCQSINRKKLSTYSMLKLIYGNRFFSLTFQFNYIDVDVHWGRNYYLSNNSEKT